MDSEGSMYEDLKISKMRVHLVDLPTQAVHSHGSGDIASIRSVILELVTTTGIIGWGEAAPWSVFTGTVEASAAALHNYFRPFVLGANPFHREKILAQADRAVVACSEAKAALETALLDITGQVLGVPVAELLGGRHRDEIPLSFSVANPDFDADLDAVAAMYDDGVRILKLKTGFADHQFDMMRLERLQSIYDDLSLRIDYNQGMKPHEAVRRLRDMESFNLAFIEQPVARFELAAMASIANALDTPLMADESVFDVREAIQAASMKLADIFSLKIMKSGGLERALEIYAIAKASGIAVYGGCMFESGVAHAAGAHLCAAIADLPFGCEFYMPTYYLKEDILCEPFPVKNGKVIVPTGSGLGVKVDEEKLVHYRIALMQ